MGLREYVYVYLLGGITFLPLVVIAFIYLHPEEQKVASASTVKDEMRAGEFEEERQTGLDAYKAGWLIVTQDYSESPDAISSSTQSISESQESKSAYSSLYKLVQKDINDQSVRKSSRSTSFDFTNGFDLGFSADADIDEPDSLLPDSQDGQDAPPVQQAPPGQYDLPGFGNQPSQPPSSPSQAQNPAMWTPPSEKVKSSQRKHRFYAILKHGNLFLYKDETLKDVKHVIVLANHFVSIWPRNLTDAQLFVKSTAIAIINSSKLAEGYEKKDGTPRGSFFIYCEHNYAKEDWYFALIRATKQQSTTINASIDPSIYAKTLHFSTSNMMDLISTLYSTEGQITTKWLNAILGRLFLAFKDTKVLEDFLYMKVNKKLNKIKKPGFLDKFIIKSIYPGDSAPFLTFPKLKEISPDGTILVSTYLSYKGCFSIEIATKLTINLGSRFRTREVDLLFRITLKSIEGPMLIKIKPPPSNRLWYTFEVEPVVDLKIEPIISSRQMTYSIITSTIDKKFKDAIRESLVYPHWDDSVFYDTQSEVYRGGIWDTSVRSNSTAKEEEEASDIKEGQDSPSLSNQLGDLSEAIELQDKDPFEGIPNKPKSKIFTDLSKRIKVNKQLIDEKLSDIVREVNATDLNSTSSSNSSSKSATMNTLKKIGKWYFKEGKGDMPLEPAYTPPEMISNRRVPRKSIASDTEKPLSSPSTSVHTANSLNKKPSYEFGIHNYASSFYNSESSSMKSTIKKVAPNGNSPSLPPREVPKPDELSINEEPLLNTDDEDDTSSNLGFTEKYERSNTNSSIPNHRTSAEPSFTGINANVSPDNMFLDSHRLTRKAPQESPPKAPSFSPPKAPGISMEPLVPSTQSKSEITSSPFLHPDSFPASNVSSRRGSQVSYISSNASHMVSQASQASQVNPLALSRSASPSRSNTVSSFAPRSPQRRQSLRSKESVQNVAPVQPIAPNAPPVLPPR